MTREEFTDFRQHYGGPETPQQQPGLWPHAPLMQRELPLWYRKLKSYPLDRLLDALNELSSQDRRNAPSVHQVLDICRTLAPPAVPVPAWQQAMARERGLTVAELLAAARPAHDARDISRCCRELFEQGLCQPGQEAAYLAACAAYAAQYPADRAFWEAQLAQKRQEVGPLPRAPERAAADQVDTLTRLGALFQRGDGHAHNL
jgi:hypothetical protein